MKGSPLCWQVTMSAEECERSALAMDAVKGCKWIDFYICTGKVDSDMKQNGSFQETIARIGQRIKSSRKRYFGVLLILLGVALGIVSGRRADLRPRISPPVSSWVSRPASFLLGFLQSCCPSSGGDDILDKSFQPAEASCRGVGRGQSYERPSGMRFCRRREPLKRKIHDLKLSKTSPSRLRCRSG